jgi:hypothetical protein
MALSKNGKIIGRRMSASGQKQRLDVRSTPHKRTLPNPVKLGNCTGTWGEVLTIWGFRRIVGDF